MASPMDQSGLKAASVLPTQITGAAGPPAFLLPCLVMVMGDAVPTV